MASSHSCQRKKTKRESFAARRDLSCLRKERKSSACIQDRATGHDNRKKRADASENMSEDDLAVYKEKSGSDVEAVVSPEATTAFVKFNSEGSAAATHRGSCTLLALSRRHSPPHLWSSGVSSASS